MSSKTKNHHIWIDIAKGIAITAIIVFHGGFIYYKEALIYIVPWMLPIFAIITGLLIRRDDNLKTYIKKRVISLLVPYGIFGLLSYALWFFLRNGYSHNAIWMKATDAFHYLLVGHDMWFNGALWFLPTYFISSILFKLILQFINKDRSFWYVIVALFTMILALLITNPKSRLIYSWDISLLFLSFMLFGYSIRDYINNLLGNRVFLIILLLVFFGSSHLNGFVDIFLRSFNNNFLYVLSALSGSLLILKGSLMISEFKYAKQWLAKVGEQSLLIMCIHWPVMQLLTYLLYLTGLLHFLQSNPTLTSFTMPPLSALRLKILQVVFLFLFTMIPVLTAFWIQNYYQWFVRTITSRLKFLV